MSLSQGSGSVLELGLESCTQKGASADTLFRFMLVLYLVKDKYLLWTEFSLGYSCHYGLPLVRINIPRLEYP